MSLELRGDWLPPRVIMSPDRERRSLWPMQGPGRAEGEAELRGEQRGKNRGVGRALLNETGVTMGREGSGKVGIVRGGGAMGGRGLRRRGGWIMGGVGMATSPRRSPSFMRGGHRHSSIAAAAPFPDS